MFVFNFNLPCEKKNVNVVKLLIIVIILKLINETVVFRLTLNTFSKDTLIEEIYKLIKEEIKLYNL